MTDLSNTIAPKSDQLNADDLIAGPRTIRVTKVSLQEAADQPIAVHFEGDNGKPYKPCKSMRRVMVKLWGSDGGAYAGRRMTIFRDDKVMFGGVAVGGIRISHMSDIPGEQTISLTVTRATRKPYLVRQLRDEPARRDGAPARSEQQQDRQTAPPAGERKPTLFEVARVKAAAGRASLDAWRKLLTEAQEERLADIWEELQELVLAAEKPARTSHAEHDEHDEQVPA